MQSTKYFIHAGRTTGWLLLFAVLACWLGPSRQSLWIDEAHTASYAGVANLPALGHRLWTEIHSEGLMPLGMLLAWGWAQMLGTSELALRLPNVAYALIGLLAFIRMARLTRLPWLPLWYLIHPFLWYYVDEARPYCLQIGAAAWFLVAVVEISEMECWSPRTLWIMLGSTLVLAGSSLLGFVQVAAAGAAVVVMQSRRKWPGLRGLRRSLAFAAVPFLILGCYYMVIVFRNGGGGSRIWAFSWQNWAFVVYEFLGFAGLGPGRETLREAAVQGGAATLATFGMRIPWLVALGAAYLAPAIVYVTRADRGKSTREQPPKFVLPLLMLLILQSAAVVAACAAAGFSVWARHLAPVFPAVVLLLAFYFGAFGGEKSRTRVMAGAVAATLLFASTVLIRLMPEHAKQDYRSAATWAKDLAARGLRVGWAADDYAARYYGLALGPESLAGPPPTAAFVGADNAPESLNALDAFILSRPEIYDQAGLIRRRIESAGYRRGPDFHGFQTFLRPAGSHDLPPATGDKDLLPPNN